MECKVSELVKRGHLLASEVSDTSIEMLRSSIASMISDLATQLDVQLARSNSLAAENAGLKSNLMFWDSEDPEAPYDNPGEIAEACSLNYNEEFVVQVAAKMPNRVYRVCESWEHECKVELVDGGEFETPATDAFLAEVRAQGLEMAAQSEQFSTWVQQGLRSFAIGVRQGDEQ